MQGPPAAIKGLYSMNPAQAVIPVEDAMSINHLHLCPARFENTIFSEHFINMKPKELRYSFLLLTVHGDSALPMAAVATAFT
jgi:hypothetical protein